MFSLWQACLKRWLSLFTNKPTTYQLIQFLKETRGRLDHLDFIYIQILLKNAHFPNIYSTTGKWIWIWNYISHGLREWLQVLHISCIVALRCYSDWEVIGLTADPVVIGFQNLCHAFMTKFLQQLRKQLLVSQLTREGSRYPFLFWSLLSIWQLLYILASHETLRCRIQQQESLVASLKEWKARLKKMQKWEKASLCKPPANIWSQFSWKIHLLNHQYPILMTR